MYRQFYIICTDGQKDGWMDNRQIFILSIYFKCIKNYMKKINTFKCINNFILICTDGRTEGRTEGLTTDEFVFYLYENYLF